MKSLHVLSSTAALVTTLALGRVAAAQDAPPDVAPPPPLPPMTYAQPGQPQAPAGAVVVVAPPGQPPAGYAPGSYGPPADEDHARIRFGIEMGGGYMFAKNSLGSARGGAFNFGLRLGAQINNPWAVYYEGNFPLGIAGGEMDNGTAVGGIAFSWNNAVVAEYTLGNMFHFGLGPSLDLALAALCANDGKVTVDPVTHTSEQGKCIGSAGPAFGMTGRIAATFGVARPGRRSAFSVGLDLHPTFTSAGTFFFTTLNLGYEAF